MKICYLANINSVHTQRWIRYFSKKGHEVHLITQNPKEMEGVMVHGIDQEEISRQLKYGHDPILSTSKVVTRLIYEIAPDILHSHYLTDYGYLGAMSGFHPFVVTVWGPDVYVNPKVSPIYRDLTRYTLKEADLVTVECEDLRVQAVKLGADEGKVILIEGGLGVDLGRFHPDIESDVRETLGLGSCPVVLSTRIMGPKYNVGSIVDCIPYILKRIPEVRFLFLGDGELRGEFEKRIRAWGIEEVVRFVGRVSYEDMPKYYVISDLWVSIPIVDALSMSLLEAMACGVVPIVGDLPSKRGWVIDGWNGYLIPLNLREEGSNFVFRTDKEMLVNRIIKLIEDDELRKRYAKRGIELVKTHADHLKNMEMISSLYQGLIEAHSHRWL